MTTALEIVSGLVLSGAFLTMVTTLAALETGRLVTRHEDQREVETCRPPDLGSTTGRRAFVMAHDVQVPREGALRVPAGGSRLRSGT